MDSFAGLVMKSNTVFSLLLIAPFASVSIPGAIAQQPIPAGGGTSTITRPDSIQDIGYWGYMANAPAAVVHGGILQGKVVIQGDPLLWEPVTVMLSCATGKTDLTAETDASGNYAITHVNLGKAFNTEDDALINQMKQHYEGCALRAPLAGYHSTAITITEKNLRDTPNLSNIVLTADEHASGTAISSVGDSASPEATKAFRLAHQDWLQSDYAAAQKDLEKAVQLSPTFAEAWYLLGRLQLRSDMKAATASLEKAVAADPRFVEPCIYLAGIAVDRRNWQEASHWAAQALALDPTGTAQMWYYNAEADYRTGRNEAALTSAETAMAMDPEHEWPNAEDVLALSLLSKGDYAGALTHLRNTLNNLPPGPSADLIKRQIAFVEQQDSTARK
jgi:tetratricopeptide (TPR) repeat protein